MFSTPGAVQVNSDDYWTPEEHEAWDAAIARSIAQNPPQPLRRHPRKPKVARLPRPEQKQEQQGGSP